MEGRLKACLGHRFYRPSPDPAAGSLSPAPGRNSKMSPGWHCRILQIASSVEKRIARAFPVLRMDKFCGVMTSINRPTADRFCLFPSVLIREIRG